MPKGVLRSINISNTGVPKHPVESCMVRENGLDRDRQRDLRFHGGPSRAVCLYSLDLIELLQAEGHPVAVGSMGENFTLSDIEWTRITPGATLEVGAVSLVVTAFAAPCRTIAGSFRNGEFVRVSQKLHAGWSRVYARVARAGAVAVGDAVRIVAS